MSKLEAEVKKIDSKDSLNIVEFNFFEKTLKMMSLDLNSNIKVGTKVKLGVKPTNVAIAKNLSGEISLSNKLPATIKDIENGELLSTILLQIENCYIESIITKDSSLKLDLKKDDEVLVLIKASNLFIEEVLND